MLLLNLRRLLPSIAVAVFISFQIVSYFFIERTVFDISFILLGVLILTTQIGYILRNHFRLFIIFSIFCVFGLYISFLGHKTNSMEPLRLMVHFVVFMLMIRYKISIAIIKAVLYGYILYVSTLILLQGTPASAILPAASENFVGWLALALGLGYYALRYTQNKRIEPYTALIVFGFALLCEGRGTIVAAIVLLLAIFYLRISQFSIMFRVAFMLVVSLIVSLYIIMPSVFDLRIGYLHKFRIKGFELDSRDIAINGYISKMNVKTFFFGVSPRQYPFTILHENFHNSFLSLMSSFGFLGFSFMIYLIYVLMRYTYRNTFMCLILLSFCLRIFTDTVAFVGLFDFFIFFIIYAIVTAQKQSQKFAI